jgi:hypothetical protein
VQLVERDHQRGPRGGRDAVGGQVGPRRSARGRETRRQVDGFERLDRLGRAVLVDDEVVLREPAHELALLVPDDDVNDDEVGLGGEDGRLGLLLRYQRGGDDDEGDREGGPEHASPPASDGSDVAC